MAMAPRSSFMPHFYMHLCYVSFMSRKEEDLKQLPEPMVKSALARKAALDEAYDDLERQGLSEPRSASRRASE